MRGDPVQFFANISLGGDHDRLLMEPVGIEAFGRFEQCSDLLGKPCPDRVGLAAGCGLGLLRQDLDLVHALREDLPERHALAPAHLDEVGERQFECCRCGSLRGLVFGLVGFRLDNLDDPLDAQEPVDARRYRVDLAGEHAGDLDDRGEHLLVDTDRGDRIGALDVQIGVHRTPRQHFAGALLGEAFEFVPSGRQPHPQIKTLGVD